MTVRAQQEAKHHYEFSVDWLSHHLSNWQKYLGPYKGRPGLVFLEIGCFEGRSTVWLLENVLTHPTSRIFCIDTFEGSSEHQTMGLDVSHLAERFTRNIAPFRSKVTVYRGESSKLLRSDKFEDRLFDFIYVDGSHYSWDVLTDLVLSWPLLKRGGMILIDDYLWGSDHPMNRPRIGVDAFLRAFNGRYQLLFKGLQLGLAKRETEVVDFTSEDRVHHLRELARSVLPRPLWRQLSRVKGLLIRR